MCGWVLCGVRNEASVGGSANTPTVEEHIWEEAGQDADLTDGEDVQVDQMTQTVYHCGERQGLNQSSILRALNSVFSAG